MATFLITACSNENDEELISTSTKGILSATVEGNHSSTRAGFASDGKFYWSQNDRLGVTTSQNASSFSALSLKNGSGTASGTFDGTINGTIGDYAVYPYYDNHNINDATLTYNFPTSYTYNKVDADYFTTVQGEGNSFNPAMWGKIVNGAVQMKHLGGVFCIKVPKMPIKAGTLSLIVDKKITGNFTVDLNGEIPVIESTETSTNENNTVTITFSDATQDQPGVFYVPVPTGTYDVRIKVTENQSSTEKVNVAAGTYTIARCDLKKIELTNGNIDATVPTESNSLDDAATALENSDAVTVTGEVSSNSSISIPAASDGTAETAKSLSLEKVASGACLTVLDANSSGPTDNSVDNFTLSIPNNEIAGFEPLDVTITMPNTTVTLAGNAGMVTYGEVIAETAKNTLIIGENVTIKKLTVKKGNVRLKPGAVIKELVHDNGYTVVYLYHETDQYTLPEPLPKKFNTMDAAIADMKAVFTNGGSYQLTKDMELVDDSGKSIFATVEASKSAILDLNGFTLKASNNSNIVVKGTLTIKDSSAAKSGKIMATKDQGNGFTSGLIEVQGENAKLVMESGTIDAVRENPAVSGQTGVFLTKGGDFSMTGGEITAGIFALTGNGNDATVNSEISIKGGKLSSATDYAVYLPQAGTTTVEGGTISGGAGGICIQRGTLNISGTETVIKSLGTGSTGDAADGTGGLPNAAICVAAEYGDCTVSISEGQISGEHDAVCISEPEGTSHNRTITITGGTFSDLSATDYIAEDGNVNIEFNKDIILTKQIITKGTMTLNLNGNTLSNTTNIWNEKTKAWSLISVQGKELTIKGDGKLAALKDDCYALDVRNNATLNIEGGEYVGNVHTVYVWEGVANIKGGEYSIQQLADGNKPYEFVLNCYDQHYKADPKKANVIVTGGTFHKFNPASNGAEGELNSTNFCPEGYTATTSDNGETYVVSSTNNR